MSKVMIPEPMVIAYEGENGLPTFTSTMNGALFLRDGDTLITTTHAEAYADARVREALEEAAALCDRFAERDMHPEECAGAIRLLITKEKT